MDRSQFATSTEMPEGKQRLRIAKAEQKPASTGVQMIELELENEEGASFLHRFCLTPRGGWALTSFVKCVLPLCNLQDFEPERLFGNTFVGLVQRNDQGYLTLAEWHSDETPPQPSGREVDTRRLF
jgi:hypothetical protein